MTTRLLGGRYEVGEVLGRGGMADVHAGYDTRLGRPVAIKLLRSDLARDGNFLVRFRREAQSAGGLNHPQIVAIYDSGDDLLTTESGEITRIPFIVMELVSGQTLRAVLNERGPLPSDEAARITEGVLTALAYSHRMGIVHRDIKPGNVMITETGDVKVMDFGIARALSDTSATMTQTQAVIGTAQYLSPEQAQGTPVDARSDLYSTGCMLYELLTGRTPFVADSAVALAYLHVGEPPVPPSQIRSTVPPAFDAVVLHSLVKDRANRYQNALVFRSDLINARLGYPVGSEAQATATMVLEGKAGGAAASARAVTAGVAAAAPAVGNPDQLETRATRRGDTGALPPVPPPTKKRRGPAYVLIVLGLIAAAAAIYALGQVVMSSPPGPTLVTVPTLAGQNEDQARALLGTRKLVIVPQPAINPDVAMGLVIDSEPPAGTQVPEGSTVTVRISAGPGTETVPNVTGQDRAVAETTLKLAGFLVSGAVSLDDPSQTKGAVISTDPPAGSVAPKGTHITLKIASGKVVVPTVVSGLRDTAQATLTNLKLVVDASTLVEDDTLLEGTVVAQDIKPGTIVDVGTTIKLTISRRPPTVIYTTPPTSSPPTTAPTTSPKPSNT
ncbi:MAG: Stk1 family PASTA domain-containing Ser/Thr kinase [Dermatophilaceae bacterium]|nr:Stk1 family PASTA domain-containing Ser/Thr kinase [Actinomycetales bacterium]MBP8881580.1 Stk1 family PASTA domain-containing Ser/Thr kinase [Dermatophilaceae bacterium]MBP9919390.1 Stk1 family PASTA domain-containing Ser/Thr kinase [Dermatophilaceae bacterium]